MSSLFNVVTTFAGCGGSSLGYKMAGGKVRLAVEWDDHAVQTYKMNHLGTPVFHGDIAKLSVDEIKEITGLKVGELDIFDGSPPCQGFSSAGHRVLDDPRNQLFVEYIRILQGMQPKVFVMENVSGMVKGKMKVIFAQILTALKDCGYDVKAKLMNAQYYGVPQMRQRMIFIGVRKDLNIPASFPKPQTAKIPAARALEGLPADKTRTLSDLAFNIWKQLKPGDDFAKKHPKGHWFNAYKVNPTRPANTITKQCFVSGSAGLYHWQYPRCLTIPELKRIGGFPDDFKFPGDYDFPLIREKDFREAWSRIGNAVPPPLMKAIAEHIYENILSKIPEEVR